MQQYETAFESIWRNVKYARRSEAEILQNIVFEKKMLFGEFGEFHDRYYFTEENAGLTKQDMQVLCRTRLCDENIRTNMIKS